MRSESQISSGCSLLSRACARNTSATGAPSLDMVEVHRGQRIAEVAPNRSQIGLAGGRPREFGDDRDVGGDFVAGQSGLQKVDELGGGRRSWRDRKSVG